MISAVIILNRSGEILCLRAYRKDFSRTILDDYRINYVAAQELQTPATFYDGFSFLHFYKSEVYYVAMTRQNANAGLVFQFLTNLPNVIKSTLEIDSMSWQRIKLHAADIIELLDEMIDSGYPQTTDVATLKLLTQRKAMNTKVQASNKQIAIMATGAISWRPNNIKYKKNEIYVEVGEKVSALISDNGKILDSVVDGNIVLKVYLSGMPECKIGFNDKISVQSNQKKGVPQIGDTKGIEVDDMVFHQCVKLTSFAKDRAITFVPPDGEFELMKYRKTTDIKIPFSISPMIRDFPNGAKEIKVVVRSLFESTLTAHPFLLKIPMPDNASKVKVLPNYGNAKFVSSQNAVVWKVSRFPGRAQAEISTLFTCLESIKKNDKSTKLLQPITAEFSIVMYSSSGLSLRYLTIIEKSNYPMDRWIRYTTRAGKFEVRMTQ